jgi:hypothetical protein
VLALQRQAGNRAVSRRLRRGRQRTLQRAETDSAAAGPCPAIGDGSSALNAEVNARIAAARSATAGRPLGDFLHAVFRQLGEDAGTGFLARIETWANSNLPHVGGGFGPSVTTGTKYGRLPFGLRTSFFLYLAPTVRLGSTCCGTDKIGHFFQQGFQYYLIAAPPTPTSAGGHIGAGQGADFAAAWGEFMEGVISAPHRRNAAYMRRLGAMAAAPVNPSFITGQERGHFGLRTSGVHSNADLAANAAGLRFYLDLASNPSTYTFDIARYVSANWNEETAGNVYSPTVGAAVRAAHRLGPQDRIERHPGFPVP